MQEKIPDKFQGLLGEAEDIEHSVIDYFPSWYLDLRVRQLSNQFHSHTRHSYEIIPDIHINGVCRQTEISSA